jgi:hypothetical protein
MNLARVYVDEGRFDEAAAELEAAGKADPPAPPWVRAFFTAQVNSANATRKEHLDAVIAEYEALLDPAAQPKDRGFDFTRDYVVWNQLANRLYKRRQYEAPGSPARTEFLHRAVKAAGRVLAEDAEDVEAHELLGRCYAELAGDTLDNRPPVALSADDVSLKAATAGDPKQPVDQRVKACADLVAGVPGVPSPKLAAIKEGVAKLGPVYLTEGDPAVRAALAAALTVLHRESHAMYKPDEVAQSRATQIYREAHPEANYVARGRVIYPTTKAHREAILSTGDLLPVE